MSFINELNKEQLKAVENTEGPNMVIAGAGSGKTRVLTYRIAHMIKNGIDPFNIMALTFTNKAAREMTNRISNIIGNNEALNITMGTFHSVFSRILRVNADRIGYPSNFTIYDSQDSKSLLKDIIKSLNLDDKTYNTNNISSRISSAKNNLISPEAYQSDGEIQMEDKMTKRPEIGFIYKTYVNRCLNAGAMDFDDLLYKTNVLLRDFPDALNYYQHKFKYILVDEYQDTNYAQYLIVKKLAALHENICVVGDDAQSIYSFRGANIQNILNFKKDYPDYKLFKLEQNYRSTKNIVEAANGVISMNKDQIKKKVWTNNSEGNKINVIRSYSDNEEGKIITKKIHEIVNSKKETYNEIAILYRTNKQSRAFEESLRKLNIPYKIYGGVSFYQRKEIKDLLAYFRLIANNKDDEALKRIYNYPKRGIGKTSYENIIISAHQEGVSNWNVFENINKYNININHGAKKKITEFTTMIKSFSAQINNKDAYTLAKDIATSSGILKELYSEKDKGPTEVERYQNIEELLAGIKSFVNSRTNEESNTLSEFMLDIALLTNEDIDDNNEKNNKNHINLMTIHSSKGLEYKNIFLVGLEENLFPSQMSLTTRKDLEEERRLFYVAITRAKENCTLSYATSRFQWGNLISSEPSRFINEIEPQFLNYQENNKDDSRSLSYKNVKSIDLKTNKLFRSNSLKKINDLNDSKVTKSININLKVGYNVKHNRFGKGKITYLDGKGANQKATIFFPHHGSKTVLLRFANLEIIKE